jgi:hypothetical protein
VKKIPTLFVRDETDRRYVTREVTSGCEWVLAGEGVATRKWDGTCVLIDANYKLWARREVKPGKPTPPEFWAVQSDETTGKTVGWEPAGQSSYAKILATLNPDEYGPGTFELIGPKVNGNPEGFATHNLVPHGKQKIDPPRNFDGIEAYLRMFPDMEGIVFWREAGNPDAGMVKIKRRDFR